jgi:ribosomal protein S18 acetylase RimI-like enzyme
LFQGRYATEDRGDGAGDSLETDIFGWGTRLGQSLMLSPRHGDADGVLIERARVADLVRIVRVHCAAFPRHFLTQLGDSFLNRYYGLILEYPLGVLLAVTVPPDGIVGFVSGFLDPPAFYGKMRKQRWKLAVSLLGALLRSPRLLRRLWYNRRRVAASAAAELDQRNVTELSSLAVDPVFQGKGIGRRLVEGFLARVREMGAQQVYLLTDADNSQRLNRFYTDLGFSGEPDPCSLAERPMNRYVKLL